jgi:hypothetical protein
MRKRPLPPDSLQLAQKFKLRYYLGHASLKTTAIYADVMGPEERAFAAPMWARLVQ